MGVFPKGVDAWGRWIKRSLGEMLALASRTSGGAEEGLSPWRADRPWVSCSVQPWQSPCIPNCPKTGITLSRSTRMLP